MTGFGGIYTSENAYCSCKYVYAVYKCIAFSDFLVEFFLILIIMRGTTPVIFFTIHNFLEYSSMLFIYPTSHLQKDISKNDRKV